MKKRKSAPIRRTKWFITTVLREYGEIGCYFLYKHELGQKDAGKTYKCRLEYQEIRTGKK